MEVKRILFILCLCLFFGSAFSKTVQSKRDEDEATYGELRDDDDDVQNDDYEYATGDGDGAPDDGKILEEEEKVEFITKSQLYIANIGDIIRLPCEVSNPELVNIWQRNEVLLSQGHVPLDSEKYPNIQEWANSTLVVKMTEENDYGKYACTIMSSNDPEKRPTIIHTVVPPTPPAITELTADNNQIEYKPGETIKLTCKATGYPKPTISWHKGSERLEIEGETIMIENVTVENEGIYRCLADNHVHKPSHQHIDIYVEHAPKITIGKYLVTSAKEKDAELVCTVDAYPEARVQWKKGDEVLRTDGNRKVSTKRKRYTIESVFVISNLTDEDFATYTCFAKNKVGKTEEKVRLVNIPAVREFVKPEKSNRDVVLTWKVESKSPISAHEIHYRKKGESEWKKAQPEVTNGVDHIYTVKYTLKDLEAGAYETKVRSKNEHGWSEFSDVMPFEGVLAKQGSTTHKNHHKKHHKEKELKEKHTFSIQEATSAPQQQEISQKEAPVGEAKSSSGNSMNSSVAILSIASILLFYIRQ